MIRSTKGSRSVIALAVLGVVTIFSLAAKSLPADENRNRDAAYPTVRADGVGAIDGRVTPLQEIEVNGYRATLVSYLSTEGQCLDAVVRPSADRRVVGSVGGCGFPIGAELTDSWVVGTLALEGQALAIALGPGLVATEQVVVSLATGNNVAAPVLKGSWFVVVSAPRDTQDAFQVFEALVAVDKNGQWSDPVDLRSQFVQGSEVGEGHDH